MPKQGSDVRARLQAYRQRCRTGDARSALEATTEALADPHYLLVARGAEICAERLIYDLESNLIQAYGRFLEHAVKRDPGCTAKGAIARALVALDSQQSGFFAAAIGYRQPEPVWGGTVDTAVDLRCSAAMGLVGTSYPRVLIELVELLRDPEPRVRRGAARAIACTEPMAAEAILRTKAMTGDREPEVIGDCLAGLLRLEPDETLEFVTAFLDDPDPGVRELAALVLGESRLEPALEVLQRHWEAQPLKRDQDRVLLRAAILHRSEAAFRWLCSLVADADGTSARFIVQELAVYRANDRLRRRLGEAIAGRNNRTLQRIFEHAWQA